MQAKLEQSHRMQQEKHTQANQNHGANRNLGSVNLLADTESLGQPERIWNRLPQLKRASRPHRVDDLVKVEKTHREAQHHIDKPRHVRAQANDHEHENHQMRESLGVLRAVHSSHAEGKESSQNSSYRRIRTRSWPRRNFQSQTLIHELLVS